MSLEKVIETDVLVIGGGMAGMFASIKAREQGASVVLVDKAYVSKSGATNYGGGYCMVFNPEWGHNLDAWMEQVSTVGEYLNDRTWTEIVMKESYSRYQDLVSWGVDFVKKDGKLSRDLNPPSMESLNMRRRMFTPVIRRKVVETGVIILDRVMVAELIKKNGSVVGAAGFHTRTGASFVFKAKATVIATGAGSFKQAGLPTHYWTADGESIAFRAGAVITGKEFEMKGFTMADYPAWRGHGMAAMAHIRKYINAGGDELARNDIIHEVHAGRGPILWNLDGATPEEIERTLRHQSNTGTTLEAERVGLDVTQGGKYPLVGGVWDGASINGGGGGIWPADTNCSSGIPGLYAAGESLASRQIGTVYPAKGLGLSGAAVTGTRAGIAASEYARNTNGIEINETEQDELKTHMYLPMTRKGGFRPSWVTQMLQNTIIPYYVWQVKHEDRMRAALTMVEFIDSHIVSKMKADDPHELRLAHETRNMAQNARLMLEASIFRKESRGSHYREDFPYRMDSEWLAWVKLKKEGEKVKVWKEPIPQKWWPDLSKPYKERYPIRFPGELEFMSKEIG